jgi:uncharacterized membrane protein YsdA (DUF1294 family)
MPPKRSPEMIGKIVGLAIGLSIVSVTCFLLLAIYVSSIAAAVFSAVPLSLTMFAIATSTFDQTNANSYMNTLRSTSVLYVVLLVFVGIWTGLSHYFFYTKKKSFVASVWPAFGCAIAVWFVISVVLITLTYTNSKVASFFNGPYPQPPLTPEAGIEGQNS